MATSHGKETVITIDSNDLSGFISSSDFDQDVDIHDASGYGDDDKEYGTGQRDATFSCEGTYDTTATGPKDVLEPIRDAGASVTMIRQIEGVGTGLPQESVSVFCTKYRETASVSDLTRWNADFQCSGAITRTDQA